MATTHDETVGGGPRLRRELRFWEAIALSIGIMAPTAAMALNGTAVAANAGRIVPLVFVFAAVGIALVAYGFVCLTSYFSHSGSVYALAGATLGPRAGFFSAWALLGTYLCFTAASSAEVGLFGSAFLDGVGVLEGLNWIWIALAAAAIIWLLASGDVRLATRSLLGMEAISVTLILILIVVIFVKLADGGPQGQDYTLDVFSKPGAVSWSAVGFATVFGILSFGGFEGAAALGEETDNPRRNIPRAIATAVLVMGVFYVICMLAQTLGFGADERGVKAFAGSSSPLGDLGQSYVGSWMSDLINLGAAISGFASALGTAAGASRLLFALGRDGFVSERLGRTSPRTGEPTTALAVVMTLAIVALIALRLNGTQPVFAFFYPGTIAIFLLLVAYAVTNVGAFAFLHLGGRRPIWEGVIPALALVVLGYVLWKNLSPVPAYPFNWFPRVAAAWLVVGLGIAVFARALAARIGAGLVESQGLDLHAGRNSP